MEVNAKARFVRMSPRKVRLVIDVVRGMPIDKALAQLSFMKKEAAPVVMSSNAPMPVPIATPTRKSSSLDRSRPASAIAMPEAATAICEKRAIRCAALRSI